MIEDQTAGALMSVLERAQHHQFTHALGGLLPPFVNSHSIKQVLDLNCRTGSWAIELALAYPGVTVTGLDGDANAIHIAQQQSIAENLTQARFYHSGLHTPLSFDDETFHLVHFQSTIGPVFQPDQWQPFLQECKRVMKPGAAISLVGFSLGPGSSASYHRVRTLADQLMLALGYSFSNTPGTHSPGVYFCKLLQEAGFTSCSYLLSPVNLGGWNNAPGRSSCQLFIAEIMQTKPLFVKYDLISSEGFDALIAQKRQDVLAADFCATGVLISAFAQKQCSRSGEHSES